MDDHHHHHDGHHHHHHCDCHDHHHHDHHGHDHGHDQGPQDTDFLDLEISQAMYGGAREMKISVVMDIVRQAMRQRLEQRLGRELTMLGQLAADEIIEDIQASLEIEARIVARQEQTRSSLEERLRAALGGSAPTPAAPARRKKAASKRRSKR